MRKEGVVFQSESVAAKPIIALTQAVITFKNIEDIDTCMKMLKESDENLAKVSPSEVMYNWDAYYAIGNQVFFGVRWYDQDFFEAKKDVYLNSHHSGIFKNFGTDATDFEVTHFKKAA